MSQEQHPPFTPYPAYKSSGVEWLGDVPSHWEVRRIRDAIAFSVNGVWGEDPDGIHDLPCVRVADFDRKRLRVNEPIPTIRAIPPNQRRNRVLKYGDLLLEKSGGGERQPVGVVMLFDHETPAVCSNFIARMSVKDGYDPFFLTFLFSALYSIRLNTRSIKQTTGIQNLDSFAYLNEYVTLPPIAEQRAIAAYLDRKGDIVHRHADVSARLIACLRELRQAEIRQAVTRGLDEDAPLRASGVEWLGDVPAHWEVRRLRTIAEMRVSNVDKHIKPTEHPVRLCNYVDVYHNERITSDIDFMRATATTHEIERFRLNKGDVIITKDSETWDDIGVPALVNHTDDDLICGYHLALLRPFKSVVIGKYLLRALQAPDIAQQFHKAANGVTRYGLTQDAIKSVTLPVPPLAEQAAIAAHLDARAAKIDAAIAHYEREAALVSEYWARLVADAVTGQIDVRAAV